MASCDPLERRELTLTGGSPKRTLLPECERGSACFWVTGLAAAQGIAWRFDGIAEGSDAGTAYNATADRLLGDDWVGGSIMTRPERPQGQPPFDAQSIDRDYYDQLAPQHAGHEASAALGAGAAYPYPHQSNAHPSSGLAHYDPAAYAPDLHPGQTPGQAAYPNPQPSAAAHAQSQDAYVDAFGQPIAPRASEGDGTYYADPPPYAEPGHAHPHFGAPAEPQAHAWADHTGASTAPDPYAPQGHTAGADLGLAHGLRGSTYDGAPAEAYGFADPVQDPGAVGYAAPDAAGYAAPADMSYPAGYDLNHYAPAAAAAEPYAPPLSADPLTSADAGYSQAYHAGLDNGHQAPGTDLAPHENEPDVYGEDYEDDEYDGEDDDRRGTTARRIVALAASLVIVVALGGALAFGYKHYVAAGAGPGTPSPVIRASTDRAKVPPTNPGGTQFSNTDSKLLGRLDRGRGVPQADSANPSRTGARSRDANDRVRAVSTLVVRPDGSLAPKAPASAAPTQSSVSSGAVPGLVIDGLTTASPQKSPAQIRAERAAKIRAERAAMRERALRIQQQRRELAARRAAPTQTAALPAATGQGSQVTGTASTRQSASQPVRLNAGASTAAVLAPATTTLRAPSSSRASQLAAGRVPLPPRNTFPRVRRTAALNLGPSGRAVQSDVAAAPATPAAVAPARPAAPSSGASPARGYGVVLASQATRMQALQTFADLQQRYTTALGDKIPDVQEADLSARGLGTMYRLVVGPPASRGSANDLCRKLRAAGYQNCWVKAY
ncbi:MAG: SPOR domain-containing protein [Pseudomonadota bacterium]